MRTYRDEGLKAQNILRVASAGQGGQTLTIGADVFELTTKDSLAVTAGRIAVDVHAGSTVKSRGRITISGAVNDTGTVTINGKVYTFQTTLTNVDGNVKIGATAEESVDNLVAAINLGTGAGTKYASAMTAHPTVTAIKSGTDKVLPQAIAGGTAGDALTLAENASNVAVDAATLGTEQAGVDPTAGEVVDALLATINASGTEEIVARKIGTNELQIVADRVGIVTLACTETLTGANNAWAAAAMYGGQRKKSRKHVTVARVPTAVEVALGNMHFELSFTPTIVMARVKPTATPNAAKAHDGGVTIDGPHVTVDNAGSTDWDANDTIEVLAFE